MVRPDIRATLDYATNGRISVPVARPIPVTRPIDVHTVLDQDALLPVLLKLPQWITGLDLPFARPILNFAGRFVETAKWGSK